MKCRGIAAVILPLFVLLSGCSSVKEELKPVPLTSIEARLGLEQQWRRNTGTGQDARYTRLQPAVVDDQIITVDVKGRLNAYRASNGKRLWRKTLDTHIGGGVGVHGDTGFVGTLDGAVIAFDIHTGAQRWKANVSSEVVSTPAANESAVVVSAIDGRVFALDYATGEQRWNYDHATPILSLRSNASPYVKDNRAFIAFDNGQLLSFDASNGQLVWTARIGQPQGKTELERLIDSDTSPLEYGPYVYGAGYNSRLVAISSGTGRLAWAQDISTANNIAISDNTVVVVDVDSHVTAYDATNGAELWQNDKLHRRGLSAPGIVGSVIFVVDQEGFAHGLSLASGELVARKRIGDSAAIAQPFTVAENVLFFDLDGVLSSHSLFVKKSSGSIWDLPTGREKGAIPTKFSGVK